MSIVTTSGFNPNALSMMNPVSNLTTSLGSAVNSAQSGIMQQLSQLLGSIGQLLSMGAQNGQFQANQGSQNIGNGLGQAQQFGNQGFNLGGLLGQGQQMGNQGLNLGGLLGQGQQMGNQGLNLGGAIGQGQQMGHQGYQLGNAFGQSQPPVNITINMGQPQSQSQVTRDCGTGSDSSQQPMTAGRASEVLNKHFDNLKGGDQTVDRGDLRRALSNPNSPAEVKDAARFLLNDSGAMRSLDTADSRARGGFEIADGRISKGDTGAAMATSGSLTQQDRNDVSVLMANKNGFAGADGLISKAEVATVAAGGRLANGQVASEAEVAAAKRLTANPEKFDRLENTLAYRKPGDSSIPKSDGKVSMEDMQLALGQ
jgi:hypothetical protein